MADLGTEVLKTYLEKILKVLHLSGATHSYAQMATSNFGIMTQIVLGYTEDKLHNVLQNWIHGDYGYDTRNYYDFGNKTKIINEDGIWWRMNLKRHWPITGKPTDNDNYQGFFYKLYKQGLSRNRILELEYLDNPIVNEALKDYDWGMKEEIIYENKTVTSLEPIMVINETEQLVPKNGLIGRIFGGHKKVMVKTKLFTGEHNIIENIEKVEVERKKVKATKDFKNIEHVIIYYKKWVELLEESLKPKEKFQDKLNKLVKEAKK